MKVNSEKEVLIGHVTQFNNKRSFGFIESGTDEFFFFIDRSEKIRLRKSRLIDEIHRFSSGDEVEFKIKPSLQDNTNLIAYDVQFIRNYRRQALIEDANENKVLKGYIKQVGNDGFFVKHINTYVYCPLQISGWEIDFQSVYLDRVEKLVEFRLLETNRIDKVKAELIDQKFCKEYFDIIELKETGKEIEALITGRNSHGYFASILDGAVEGFILFPAEEKTKFDTLRNGDIAIVTIKVIHNNKKVHLTLLS